MIDDEKTLENLNDFISSFSEAKYFILITDDVMWHHWMFFIQNKDDIYHVIVYFINHLINQDMTSSVFAHFNWILEIDFKELQFFMSTKDCKWESSAAYNQHQDETFKWAIQIILCQMKAVMIQTKLFLKLWAEIDQSVIYLINISSTFMKLYSELLTDKIVLTSYEMWHDISYSHSKILRMIEIKAVIHKEELKLKKAGKLLEQSKKMILVRYRDWSIYQLYNKKSDSVIISESVDFNKDLLTNENTENSETTDQSSIFKIKLFIKFFIEFFTQFFNEDNKKIFNSSNLISESVRNKAEAKKNTIKILSSQKKMSIMRHEKLKKKTMFVNRVILSVKILEW